MDKLKRLWSFIIKEDKKLITLLTTLVNVKCLAFYILSKVFFEPSPAVTFTNGYFAATSIIAIFDLWLCWGFIHSCVKVCSLEKHGYKDETLSAFQTAKSLTELRQGNIIMSGIYSFDYVTQIERETVKGDEIWCISGDLEEDSNNSDLGNIITNNLKKGVVYKYFVTRVGDAISNKASWGEEKLREANAAYKKRLAFIKTNEELVAPDIDIIIYKANRINERIGFVCIEIGDDPNTYVYQQIDNITLQGLYDKLSAYVSIKRKPNFLPRLHNMFHNTVHFCVEHLAIAYCIVSAGGLTLLSFSKIVSLTSAVLFLLPAIIEFLITITLVIMILDSISTYKDALSSSLQKENILAGFINRKEIKSAAEILKKNILDTLMEQKGLGNTDKIFQVDRNCSAIWLLSDLSHDIANQSFYDWLMRQLDTYQSLKCHILYTKGPASTGRISRLKKLETKYSDRMSLVPLDNMSVHYIWSKTHGIVIVEKINMQHDVYIALGTGNNAFYKKVIATEEESATMLGRLTNMAGQKL